MYFNTRIIIVLIGLCLLGGLSTEATEATEQSTLVINIQKPMTSLIYDRGRLFEEILRLALDKTELSYGPYQIKLHPVQVGRRRLLRMVKAGSPIDVAWGGNIAEREKSVLPIKISLLKQLNEYRVLLIRKGEQKRFSAIDSLESLQGLTAGSGTHWYDTKVMRNNNIHTIVSAEHDSLYRMLAMGRFDYISRGIYEIESTLRLVGSLGLADQLEIEKTLMVYYHVPFYFFVNKDNKALAERLETGLKIAMADGSFDLLFFQYPDLVKGYTLLNQHKRNIINLEVDAITL
ncbi:MAG: hypothetical protein ACI93R_001548 [Flavobacteriales bacterium]|jgi:hypothetical protein